MTITLSPSQQNAVERFNAFSADPTRTIFALLGYAGTGKTFTYSQIAGAMQGQVLMAAPTHKAINVVRRNLMAAGVDFASGYDPQTYQPGKLITGTTAQLVGLQPVITDDQTEDSRSFAKAGSGVLGRLKGSIDWVVIDESSMMSQEMLDLVEVACMEGNAKLMLIGDPGQLPPVKAEPIDWDAIPDKAVLTDIMRQAGDSAIPLLAQAIREEADWRQVTGPGVTHSASPGKDFLDQVTVPTEAEAERTVFIAYRNKVVDEVTELACREVYGHGRNQFEPGQIVISQSRLEKEVPTYIAKYGRSYPRAQVVANNADELMVDEIGGPGQWGTEVKMHTLMTGTSFEAEYLTPEDAANPRHPYNVAVKAAFATANDLQARWKKDQRNYSLDDSRKAAWKAAFELKDRAVISFRHPFALTSHKSQGSTYKNVFVDAEDIEVFDSRGLYVAATRPSTELIIG